METAAFWRTSHHDGKLAQAGHGGGGARPPPFTYHHVQSVVYAPAERADTLPLFHLYPYMCSVDPSLYAGTGGRRKQLGQMRQVLTTGSGVLFYQV